MVAQSLPVCHRVCVCVWVCVKHTVQDLEVAPDLASAAQPIANAKVPLSAAFSTPSAAATHREVMKDTLQRNNRPGTYVHGDCLSGLCSEK